MHFYSKAYLLYQHARWPLMYIGIPYKNGGISTRRKIYIYPTKNYTLYVSKMAFRTFGCKGLGVM